MSNIAFKEDKGANMKQATSKHQSGFTLIEMAVVMIIIGLITAGLFAALKVEQERQIIQQQRESFDNVFDALREFINSPNSYYANDASWAGGNGMNIDPTDPMDRNLIIGGRFPCPADPAAGLGNPNFGIESVNAALAPNQNGDDDTDDANELGDPAIAHTCDLAPAAIASNDVDGSAGITEGDVFVGALPFVTMGLSSDIGIDAYGNQYTYAVTAGATKWGAAEETPGYVDNFTIDNAGAPADTGIDTVFAVVSHGEDGRGAYTKYGALVGACAGTLDSENCDGDATFIVAGAENRRAVAGAGYYDDLASGTLTGINMDDEFWDINAVNNIFNINDNGNGNVGIGTDDDAAFNLTQSKLTIKMDSVTTPGPNLNIPHFHLLNEGTNDGRFSYGGGATTPEADSFALYLQDYTSGVNGPANPFAGPDSQIAGTSEAIVFENLDINNPNPDDGMYFINTGNDGVQEIGMYLSGDNWLRVGRPDGNQLTDQSSAQTASNMDNRGFIETPWIYTQGIEASNERLGGSTGITVGRSATPGGVLTEPDTVGLYTQGQFGLFLDGHEDGAGDDVPPPVTGVYIDTRDNDGDPLNIIDLAPAIGVGTNDPAGVLDINTSPGGDFLLYADDVTGGVSVDGRVDNPNPGTETAGRMIFDVDSGAFRAGIAEGTEMDSDMIGTFSIGLGRNIRAPADGSVGIGDNIEFSDGESLPLNLGTNSVGLGTNLSILGSDSVVLGRDHTFETQDNDRNYVMGRQFTLSGTATEVTALGNGAGSTLSGSNNFVYLDGDTSNITGDENVIFSPGGVDVNSNGNFVWSNAGGTTVGGTGDNIAFFNNGSVNSAVTGNNSMGVFLDSPGSSVTGSQSIGYFMGQSTAQSIIQNNVFAIMGDNVNVGIGTVDPQAELDVIGVARAFNHIDYSDRRLKKDIVAMESNMLEKINKLHPVSYKFKTKDEGGIMDSERTHLGFIAQDVRKIFPQSVHEDNEGYLSLSYGSLTAPLVGAVQELSSQNNTLQETLANQEDTLRDLQDQQNNIDAKLASFDKDLKELQSQIGLSNPKKASFSDILIPSILVLMAGFLFGFFRKTRTNQ